MKEKSPYNNVNPEYEINHPTAARLHREGIEEEEEFGASSSPVEYYYDEYNNRWLIEYDWSPQERHARDMGWDG